MIHEFRPGDVVVLTVAEPTSCHPLKVKEIEKLLLNAGVNGMLVIGGTKTSVHVLRKVDDKPGWPVWRDAKLEKPPFGSMILGWNYENHRVEYGMSTDRNVGITHWMPLPEGPKV